MLQIWIVVMHLITPRRPVENLAPIAQAAIEATDNPAEQAAVIGLDLHERGWHPHGIPYGATSFHRFHHLEHPPLVEYARSALRNYRMGLSRCRTVAGAAVFYNTGTCTPVAGRGYHDRFSSTVSRLRTGFMERLAVHRRSLIAGR